MVRLLLKCNRLNYNYSLKKCNRLNYNYIFGVVTDYNYNYFQNVTDYFAITLELLFDKKKIYILEILCSVCQFNKFEISLKNMIKMCKIFIQNGSFSTEILIFLPKKLDIFVTCNRKNSGYNYFKKVIDYITITFSKM